MGEDGTEIHQGIEGSESQVEALGYFSRSACEWQEKTRRGDTVIDARSEYALQIALAMGAESALDVGCGTGEVAHALASAGIATLAVDFAKPMIDLCPADSVLPLRYLHADIFELETPEPLDLIVANGFIEYLSPWELVRFFQKAEAWLRPGGSLVVSSRNRLFNAISLNAYTELELELQTVPRLLREAIELQRAVSCENWRRDLLDEDPLPEISAHPRTGIAVGVRHQYTPAELAGRLGRAGLETVDVQALHYHALPPAYAKEHPEEHERLARLLQARAGKALSLIPFASSFLLHARARE